MAEGGPVVEVKEKACGRRRISNTRQSRQLVVEEGSVVEVKEKTCGRRRISRRSRGENLWQKEDQ